MTRYDEAAEEDEEKRLFRQMPDGGELQLGPAAGRRGALCLRLLSRPPADARLLDEGAGSHAS